MDPATGYDEHRRIANYLSQTPGVQDYLIQPPEAWDCLYDTLMSAPTRERGLPRSSLAGQRQSRPRHASALHTDAHQDGGAAHPSDQQVQRLRSRNRHRLDSETNRHLFGRYLTGYRTEVQAELDATPSAVWTHAPHPHWVIFPMCGESQRYTWDFSYPHLSAMTGTV